MRWDQYQPIPRMRRSLKKKKKVHYILHSSFLVFRSLSLTHSLSLHHTLFSRVRARARFNMIYFTDELRERGTTIRLNSLGGILFCHLQKSQPFPTHPPHPPPPQNPGPTLIKASNIRETLVFVFVFVKCEFDVVFLSSLSFFWGFIMGAFPRPKKKNIIVYQTKKKKPRLCLPPVAIIFNGLEAYFYSKSLWKSRPTKKKGFLAGPFTSSPPLPFFSFFFQ